MTDAMLIDTGPLVAIVDRRDARHEACLDALKRTSGPLFTVWPVIAEAMHILRRVPRGATGLLDLLETASVVVPNVDFDLAGCAASSAGMTISDPTLRMLAWSNSRRSSARAGCSRSM